MGDACGFAIPVIRARWLFGRGHVWGCGHLRAKAGRRLLSSRRPGLLTKYRSASYFSTILVAGTN
jgi:hypothetical protein